MARSPLFDLYDPAGTLANSLDLGIEDDPLGIVPVRRKPRVEDLMSEEEQASMLQNLAYAGASGLSSVGWLLDTPGSMVRGLLSEGPMKAISALWETSDDRVTGRELARQYGLAGKEDNWGNFGGGLATEVLLDPLTYASFGLAPLLGGVAKTAAGKAATKAGLLGGDLGLMAKQITDRGARGAGYGKMALQRETPEFLLDQINKIDPGRYDELMAQFRNVAGDQADALLGQRMSASNRISIPGIYDGARDLFGEGFGNAVTSLADQVGQSALANKYTGPVLRNMRAMFDSRIVDGSTDAAGQWRARAVTEAERLGNIDADKWIGERIPTIADEIGMERWQKNDFRRQLSDAFGLAMENQTGTEAWRELPDEIRNLFDGGGGSMLVDEARSFQQRAIQRAESLGLPLAETKLPFDIGYLTRQKVFPENPVMPKGYEAATSKAIDGGTELFGLPGEASRRDWTRAFPRWVLNKMAKDDVFQDSLRRVNPRAQPEAAMNMVDDWLRTKTPDYWTQTQRNGIAGPYSYLLDDLEEGSAEAVKALERTRGLYGELADSVASLPTNYAKEGLPFYGDALTDFTNYVRSRGRTERVGQTLYDELAKAAINSPNVPSFSSFTAREALQKFGLDIDAGRALDESGNVIERSNAEKLLEAALGRNRSLDGLDPITAAREADRLQIDNLRIPQDLVESLTAGVQRARAPAEATGLLKGYDNFLQRFKSLALLFPSRYTRDMYSGSFAAATQGLFNPLDSYAGLQVGRGNYKPLARRLKNAPGYEDLSDEDRILKFLSESSGQRLTDFNILDDMGRNASNLTTPDLFPGSAGPYLQGVGDKMNPRTGAFWNPFALRRRSGNPNWLLAAGDAAATASDSWNRIGTYLTAVRQGYVPEAAKAASDLSQVVYRPEAFSSFERDVIKRLVPFYSYTKGIAPLVADNLVNQPAGLMGQSIRFVNRAGEPSEDRFVPEYLRQSAAVPLGGDVPLIGLNTPGVTRFLTNIDLPHEGLLNLFTPGLGNTLTSQVGNSIMRTGQNILGQTTPALKGPLEYVLDRQFFTGRQLSDLYSMLEHDFGPIGRPLEQIISNAPGGSRALGLIRQARDERISPSERAAKMAFNTLTGMKLQDVDQDRTVRLAARSALNELLQQAEGVGTYENLFIKPEALQQLSPQEQRQYLLYRVLQSRASREAREKKKQELQDPMQMLGLS
jgi:hypothetical protein